MQLLIIAETENTQILVSDLCRQADYLLSCLQSCPLPALLLLPPIHHLTARTSLLTLSPTISLLALALHCSGRGLHSAGYTSPCTVSLAGDNYSRININLL